MPVLVRAMPVLVRSTRLPRRRSMVAAVALALGLTGTAATAAGAAHVSPVAATASTAPPAPGGRSCPPLAWALGYSDALDKKVALNAEVGGLSALVKDPRRHAWAAIEDHSDGQQTRMWFLRDVQGPGDPTVVGTLLLHRADGTPYDDTDFDAEGLAVLPDGRYVVTSEVEPSIHIFGRDGTEVGRLRVPDRFRVAPEGEATDNATLEGLTISRDGRTIYAAMEGTLSGDVSPSGDDTFRRIVVYHRHHGHYRLAKQVGYRIDPGMRIAEVTSYGRDSLLVLEAAWNETDGNTIRLYAATRLGRAADVSAVPDLGDHPELVAPKTAVADVTACPDLGATAKEAQTNPLMDNYEAMAITGLNHHAGQQIHGRLAEVVLLSDDNFNDVQTTRVLRLAARLPPSSTAPSTGRAGSAAGEDAALRSIMWPL